jgi:ubiquinone/menaquinone biosynthesis C-methylase UbiE
MIALAVKDAVAKTGYLVRNANSLQYPEGVCDTVLMGGLLCCTEQWEQVVAEAARVASAYLMFHRMPLYQEGPETRIVMHDVYGTEAPFREFREEYAEAYMAKFGRIVGSEYWPYGDYRMGSYLVEIDP